MTWLLLAFGLLSLAATVTALVRVRRPVALGFFVMVTSWLTGEYPLFHVVWQAIVAGVLAFAGALDEWPGVVGAIALALSWVGLVVVRVGQRRARPTAETALQAGLGDGWIDQLSPDARSRLRTRPERTQMLLPFRNDRTGIAVERDLPYGDHRKRNLLDVYRPERGGEGAPVVVQIHGGGWMIGHKRQQGMPLVHRLAANGFVCVSINYRLAPRSHFPDQLIDVKRAIHWTREHIAEFGGDPATIILTGGSAGGHLAALAALTPGRAEYQPGFEDADTSVAACMPFYGPTDFTDSAGVRGRLSDYEVFLRHTVMPGTRRDEPELYEQMSPLTHVHEGAPPFLIVQGTLDTLVWKEENRVFADRLRSVSAQPVVHWEVPGAQHAFDWYHSRRSAAAVDTCERFAAWVVATADDRALDLPDD